MSNQLNAYNKLMKKLAKRIKKLNKAGLSAPEISRALNISVRTVHRHRAKE